VRSYQDILILAHSAPERIQFRSGRSSGRRRHGSGVVFMLIYYAERALTLTSRSS